MPKTWLPLENNPSVLTPIAHTLGLSPTFSFQDLYSFTDASLLAHIPRPVYALVVTIPMSPAWAALRAEEEANFPDKPPYSPSTTGAGDPVIWFTQTIGHACGSIGVIHAVINSIHAETGIKPDSFFSRLQAAAPGIPDTSERAKLLYDSAELENAHEAAQIQGDTVPPGLEEADRVGNHFIAFVKRGGRLWELEGSRKGPLDRGALGEGEDVLSERAYRLGLGKYLRLDMGEAGVRVSGVALVGGGGGDGEDV